MNALFTVVLTFLVSTSLSVDQDLHCKPKLGCRIARCDPAPTESENVGQFLFNNEFPLLCQLPEKEVGDRFAVELRKQMDEFKKEMKLELDKVKAEQKSALNEMQEKLDTAQKAVGKLIESQYSGYGVKCPPPPKIDFGEVKCKDDTFAVGSLCSVSCLRGREIKGKNNIVCDEKGQWSKELPTCNCVPCKLGDNCEHSTSWRDTVDQISESGSSSLIFAGRKIECVPAAHFHNWQLKWRCTCTDVVANKEAECSGLRGSRGSCEHAVSKLIRKLMETKEYPAPCDLSAVRVDC